jgi:hypothetical protein
MSSLEENGRETAAALFAAIEREEWSQVAGTIHPEAMRAFYEAQCQQAEHTESLRAMSPEALGWSAEEMRKYIPPGSDPFLRAIWGVASASELRGLGPRIVLERFLGFHLRASVEQERPLRRILGVVPQGREFLHVVFQGPTGWEPRADWLPVDVLTLRATPEGWRALLNGNLVFDSRGGYTMAFGGADSEPPDEHH